MTIIDPSVVMNVPKKRDDGAEPEVEGVSFSEMI